MRGGLGNGGGHGCDLGDVVAEVAGGGGVGFDLCAEGGG